MNSSVKLLRFTLRAHKRNYHTTTSSCSRAFHELDEKSGYPIKYDRPPKQPKTIIEKAKAVCKFLKEETLHWKNDMVDQFQFDPVMVFRPNEIDVKWRFKNNPMALDEWVVTCDSDYDQGYSKANLELSQLGTGVFSGMLDTRVPKDGKQVRSGYCNVKTTPIYKAFKQEVKLDWGMYNILALRVRGDGRNYMINLNMKGYFDMFWNDTFSYVLYTRGGPYWQYVKIPFSKFIFSSKGRVQDGQFAIPLQNVSGIGITVADKKPGPFRLEIDYIGCTFQPGHTEKSAYESYRQNDPLIT